jgi:asparagine synthase (glutamine-hydrolysing)
LKRTLKLALGDLLPPPVAQRKDKMGFPVPLTEWIQGPLREFVLDTFAAAAARRDYLTEDFSPEHLITREAGFGRSLWGLLSLEVWHQQYHDRGMHWRALRERMTSPDVYETAVGG